MDERTGGWTNKKTDENVYRIYGCGWTDERTDRERCFSFPLGIELSELNSRGKELSVPRCSSVHRIPRFLFWMMIYGLTIRPHILFRFQANWHRLICNLISPALRVGKSRRPPMLTVYPVYARAVKLAVTRINNNHTRTPTLTLALTRVQVQSQAEAGASPSALAH